MGDQSQLKNQWLSALLKNEQNASLTHTSPKSTLVTHFVHIAKNS